jgi:hypothetical protein
MPIDPNAVPAARLGWVNPPADVTNAIAVLKHQCELWPKVPVNTSMPSGAEDMLCQVVAGYGLAVPANLAEALTFLLAEVAVAAMMLVIMIFVVRRAWRYFFGPPQPPKPKADPFASLVVVIGLLGWMSAAGLVGNYTQGWSLVFMLTAGLWIFAAPHFVVLLRTPKV